MKGFYKSVFLLLLIGCSTPKQVIFENKSFEIVRPPGTVEIAENLYADETEIRNIDYKEFMFWIGRIYGEESPEYQSTKLDETVWLNQNDIPHLSISYFEHPMYDDYPVVGISYEQAKQYTEWRTERVAEMLLIERGYIEINEDLISGEKYFTIQRYLEGGYTWIKVRKDVVFPKYRLPNSEEWESLAKGNTEFQYGMDPSSKYNRKVLKNWKHLFNTNEYFSSKVNEYKSDLPSTGKVFYVTSPSVSFSKNVNGLLGMIGNVAEMTSEKGIAKGGSWKSNLKEIKIENTETYDQPNSWVGFRNICQWELKKIK